MSSVPKATTWLKNYRQLNVSRSESSIISFSSFQLKYSYIGLGFQHILSQVMGVAVTPLQSYWSGQNLFVQHIQLKRNHVCYNSNCTHFLLQRQVSAIKTSHVFYCSFTTYGRTGDFIAGIHTCTNVMFCQSFSLFTLFLLFIHHVWPNRRLHRWDPYMYKCNVQM